MKTIQFIDTSPEQLTADIMQGVKAELENLKKEFLPKQPNEYLTRQEVADWLKVDLSTLWLWVKKGKLISYGIGNRVYFKREEVESAIIALKQRKGDKL
jgi:excisionase family DNA binding protein